ncbi:hypothetical protein [Lacinutrix sp. Bg11-31]|uniref:hypothetical protein n=1 Tax=Lacinutrix sp. Bg11-31 TaxID=2057808 RepID=UPI000C307D52|nr:hypothetical protein [Lacinutrix sp. Bg11-31]AUC82346.1 hypothetical protein CW733_09455 [Lacinutrix sp. Bg11-31]
MKKIKLSSSLLVLALLVFASCDSDDDGTGNSTMVAKDVNVNYVIPFGNQVNIVETDMTYSYTAQLSAAQIVDTYVPVTLVGGTATEGEDFDFDHSIYIGSRSAEMVTGTVTIHRDLAVEPTETFTLRIGDPVINANSTPQEITFTLVDYVTCNWTFEMTDTYGDGWNGGYIEVNSNGDISTYAAENLDGVTGSETQVIDVAIQDAVDFSITYVSGGGTGNGPGWESENNYVITSPDGTVYSDGPIPTAGVIVSGSDACN